MYVSGNLGTQNINHNSYFPRLPWSNLLEPAIGIAKSGFKVNQDLGQFRLIYFEYFPAFYM